MIFLYSSFNLFPGIDLMESFQTCNHDHDTNNNLNCSSCLAGHHSYGYIADKKSFLGYKEKGCRIYWTFSASVQSVDSTDSFL